MKRHDDHYIEGKWIDCKKALLKDELKLISSKPSGGSSSSGNSDSVKHSEIVETEPTEIDSTISNLNEADYKVGDVAIKFSGGPLNQQQIKDSQNELDK